MFTRAIVRRPCRAMVNGLTSANLGKPFYENALKQHDFYIRALERCGLDVVVLEADERYPDSVFVEDTAVLVEKCAIITNLGAPSRQGEEEAVKKALIRFFPCLETITAPGTIEGGDVMRVGEHFYVGLSARTNREGAMNFAAILNLYGYQATLVPLKEFLHLKTGLAYLENNNLLVAGEFIHAAGFMGFNRMVVDEAENYAANSIWVNGIVLVPAGFVKTRAAIKAAGYEVVEVDVSEFRKLDGGLSCLSLRF